VSLVDNLGSLTINVTGVLTQVTSPGGGVSLLQNGEVLDTGSAVELRSLVAGANITLTPAGDTITIASTGGGGGVTSVSSVGAGDSLLQFGAASDAGEIVELRSILGTTRNVAVTDAADTLTFSIPDVVHVGSVDNYASTGTDDAVLVLGAVPLTGATNKTGSLFMGSSTNNVSGAVTRSIVTGSLTGVSPIQSTVEDSIMSVHNDTRFGIIDDVFPSDVTLTQSCVLGQRMKFGRSTAIMNSLLIGNRLQIEPAAPLGGSGVNATYNMADSQIIGEDIFIGLGTVESSVNTSFIVGNDIEIAGANILRNYMIGGANSVFNCTSGNYIFGADNTVGNTGGIVAQTAGGGMYGDLHVLDNNNVGGSSNFQYGTRSWITVEAGLNVTILSHRAFGDQYNASSSYFRAPGATSLGTDNGGAYAHIDASSTYKNGLHLVSSEGIYLGGSTNKETRFIDRRPVCNEATYPSTVDDHLVSKSYVDTAVAAGGADPSLTYLTKNAEPGLPNSQFLAQGTRILLEDAGAGNELFITARHGAGFAFGLRERAISVQTVAPAASDLFAADGSGSVSGGQSEPNFTFTGAPDYYIRILDQGWVNVAVFLWARLAVPSGVAGDLQAEIYQNGNLVSQLTFATNLGTSFSFNETLKMYIDHPVNGTYTLRIRNNYAVDVEFGPNGVGQIARWGVHYLGGANS
ncbi:MAG TPA: hypothetical protein VLL52_22315, partial [Anaerolineae bacterium]|nr:hypothetical protein [Anaerolineae bacterium]